MNVKIEKGTYSIETSEEAIGFIRHYNKCYGLKDREVTLAYVPNNNHGCQGASVTVLCCNDNEGIIIETHHCTSCYNTGCDRETKEEHNSFYMGKMVKLPYYGLWWEEAERDVTDERMKHLDISYPFCTRVTPDELFIVE